ncbi:MAG TPA: metal-sensitive transcriptional regulator [Oscillospiraceae bacterium]|nr:metal-sensitive transcriptional regulator [Oscillospiraceae bacterium]
MILLRGPKKDATLRRLKTAGGHLKAVERMVEDDKYCADVLLQLQAVIASLEKVSNIILENHLETCLRAAMRRGEEEEVIDELKTFMKYKIK